MSERLGVSFLSFSPVLELTCMPDGVAGCLNAGADEQLCDLGGESCRAASGVQPEAVEEEESAISWDGKPEGRCTIPQR